MGLISTEVEVGLCGKNITYYENLGYDIPRVQGKYRTSIPRGTKIIVKVKDLSCGSHVLVKVRCDCCDKIYNLAYQTYYEINHNGQIYCNSCSKKIFNSGKNHSRWNFNKTDEERLIKRNYPEYTEFVKKVLARDNYTCQCCGKHDSSHMEVHHLDGYDWCKEKRTDVTNGITLCRNCHESFHCQYGKGKNTQTQFEEWIDKVLGVLEEYNGVLLTTRKVFDYEERKVYQSVKEYCNEHKVGMSNVYSCCNRVYSIRKLIRNNNKTKYYENRVCVIAGHHLFWFDEYEKMTSEELQYYLEQSINKSFTKIICITTGQLFNSMNEASQYYKIDRRGIGDCCRGRYKHSGKLNGVPLKWMYLSDFKKLPQEEQEKILANVKEELS